MTRAPELNAPRTGTDVGDTLHPRTAEGRLDEVFSFRELARLDEALTMSSRETGLRFTLYVGELRTPTRAHAEELHARSGDHPSDAVLIAVSPGQRVVEVVTGAGAARRLPDRACALAVLSMTSAFANGDLVGGIVNGLRQLSDQAGHPAGLRTH
ncbi:MULTISPECIES: DUF5130 family protein [unclassified Blastococcus]